MIVRKTVWDMEIFKFDEMDREIRRLRRLDLAEELSTSARAGVLELQLYREAKMDRLKRAAMKEQGFWENLKQKGDTVGPGKPGCGGSGEEAEGRNPVPDSDGNPPGRGPLDRDGEAS